jgi:5'-3' exonuclease
VGDTSDNISGVAGYGPKTVAKLFPALSLPEKLTTDYLYETCENPPKKSVLYDRVLFVKNLVEVTHQVVSLRNVNMMDTDRKEIIRLFEKKVLPLNKSSFLQLWQEDRLHDAIRNVEKWLDLFAPLGRYKNL